MAIARLYLELGMAAMSLQIFTWYILYNAWADIWLGPNIKGLLCACIASVAAGICLFYVWVLSRRPSPYQSFRTLHTHILLRTIGRTFGSRILRQAEASWKAPRRCQEKLLLSIIQENCDTEYGRKHNLKAVKSLRDFQKIHPLTTYEDYRPYIERTMKGDVNILTKRDPTTYIRTTGTTGKSKYIPLVSKKEVFQTVVNLTNKAIFQNFPSIGLLQKRVYFYVHPLVTKTTSGIPIETLTTLPVNTEVLFGEYTTPAAGYRITASYEATYIHFLFALREADVGVFHIGFVNSLESAMQQLRHCWRDILKDMAEGTINDTLSLPEDIRSELTAALGKGAPQRASQLSDEFARGFTGIMRRVWPKLQVITAIDQTGVWPRIHDTYAKGVAFMHGSFGCSEGFFALYLGPRFMDKVAYVLLPSLLVTEFIKAGDIDEEQPTTYLIDELEIGGCYEVVLTQAWSGFYRYRLGDVFRVTGFRDNCPIIQFLYRTGQMLNVCYEKIDQVVMEESVRAAVDRWKGARLVHFAVAESTLIPTDSSASNANEDAPYYLIFVELDWKQSEIHRLRDNEKSMIDEELCARNSVYDSLRHQGCISQPRVYPVRSGAFEELKDRILDNTNASAIQYKLPLKLISNDTLEVMLNNVLK